MKLDDESCYRAVRSRDRRFEGRFVLAVRTTGVYCRPGCPAPLPSRRNCVFLPCAAAAEEEGFRPCRRCRPETAPGTPVWSGTSATVGRALRLIGEGALDAGNVDGLAERLGVGGRHLRRLFAERLGASPASVARTRRVHFARRLLDDTTLPVADVAEVAGYGSVRSFNETFLQTFGRPPREVRRMTRAGTRREPGMPLALRLSYRSPFDWDALLGFLSARAVPGVEQVEGGVYRRTVEAAGVRGHLEVSSAQVERRLELRVHLSVSRGLVGIVERVSRLLDLDADPLEIAAHLRPDAVLGPLVERRPGLRLPGAFTPFEGAVRAVLAQQVSTGAARTLGGRLAARFGSRLEGAPPGLDRLFPGPAQLAGAPLEEVGLTGARATALRALARAVRDGALALEAPLGLDDVVERLVALPGIGAWTAQVIAMRALGEPDAFPAGDLALRRAYAERSEPVTAGELEERSRAWRPWRAYAAVHLWTSLTDGRNG